MATSIGPKIGVEGYEQFKYQMDVIVSKLKVLDAEAAALEKQYQGHTDSLDYLTKKSELYSKQLDLQKQRVEEATKWEEKVTEYVGKKEQATEKDNAAVAKANELTAKYNAELQITEINANQTAEAIDNYADNLLDAGKKAEQSGQISTAAAVAVGNVVSQLITKTVELGKRALETGIRFNASMESYKASFSTLLGSGSAADKALSEILKNANQAPTFSIDAIADANRSLLATGMSAETANKAILDLATALAAAGQGDDALRRMATNMQQIANNGQAYAIDLKQFNNVGIPVYKLISEYTGKSLEDASEMTVTYDLLAKSLERAAGEGGMFYGALETQAQTLNGQINALKNNLSRGLGKAFEGVTNTLESKLLPALNKFLTSDDGIENLVSVLEGAIASLGVLEGGLKIAAFKSSEDFKSVAEAIGNYKKMIRSGHRTQQQFNEALTLSNVVIGVMSGEMTIAEAATWALNTAMAALPLLGIAAGIGAVTVAVSKSSKDYKEFKENLKSSGTTVKELEADLASLREKESEMAAAMEEQGTYKPQMLIHKLAAVRDEIAITEQKIRDMGGIVISADTDKGSQLNNIVETTKAKLAELYAAYDEAYAASLTAAQKEFDLFELVEESALTSTADMIAALDSQKLYWENYAENLEMVRDVNYGLSQDLIAFLSDGSQESAAYLQSIINDVAAAGGSTSEAGQKIIQDINSSFGSLQAAQQGFAEQSALTSTNLEEEVSKTIQQMKEDMEELDVSDEMQQMAYNNISAYINELSSQANSLYKKARDIGKGIANNMQAGIDSVPIKVPTVSTDNPKDDNSAKPKGYAAGLDYVPYDNFPAYLHKGEMVLTAAQAADYRASEALGVSNTTNMGGVTLNVYGAAGQDVNELADIVIDKLGTDVNRRNATWA